MVELVLAVFLVSSTPSSHICLACQASTPTELIKFTKYSFATLVFSWPCLDFVVFSYGAQPSLALFNNSSSARLIHLLAILELAIFNPSTCPTLPAFLVATVLVLALLLRTKSPTICQTTHLTRCAMVIPTLPPGPLVSVLIIHCCTRSSKLFF